MGKRKGGGRNSSLKKMIVDAILSANDPATLNERRIIAANAKAQKDFADTLSLTHTGYRIVDPKNESKYKDYELKCKAKKLGKQPQVVCTVPAIKGDKSLRKMISDFANRFARIERYAEKHGGLDGIRKGRKKPCKGRGRTKAGTCRKARRSRR